MTYYHVGCSGGKDSTALLGWVIFESGLEPESVIVTSTDTLNEYPEVHDQIARLSDILKAHGFRGIKTLMPERGFLELAKFKKRFPSAKARFCTELLKMAPCRKFINAIRDRGHVVICLSGVRAAESDARAALPAHDYDGYLQAPVWRPLLDWSIAQVWDAHAKWGLPINPLYFQGRKRVGCRLCCMSSKEDVRRTSINHPEVIAEYREWEKIVAKARLESGLDEMASFFGPKTVPDSQCSKTYTNRHGKVLRIATIDDVERWSHTLRGGTQIGFDFMYEEDDDFDGGLSCKSAMGHCE